MRSKFNNMWIVSCNGNDSCRPLHLKLLIKRVNNRCQPNILSSMQQATERQTDHPRGPSRCTDAAERGNQTKKPRAKKPTYKSPPGQLPTQTETLPHLRQVSQRTSLARPVHVDAEFCPAYCRARSGAFGPFRVAGPTSWNSLPDRLPDPILRSDNFRKNCLKRNYLPVSKHTIAQ